LCLNFHLFYAAQIVLTIVVLQEALFVFQGKLLEGPGRSRTRARAKARLTFPNVHWTFEVRQAPTLPPVRKICETNFTLTPYFLLLIDVP
jgi:hypothetical protein